MTQTDFWGSEQRGIISGMGTRATVRICGECGHDEWQHAANTGRFCHGYLAGDPASCKCQRDRLDIIPPVPPVEHADTA